MGATQGSATYLRFFVDGEVPKDMAMVFEQAIEARRFLPMERGGKEASGWVPLDSPYDDETPITKENFYFGHLLGLGYREDKVSIPKGLIVHETKLKLNALQKVYAKEGKKITRQTRLTVRAAVSDELAKKTLPKTRVMDVLWDVTQNELRIFGRGPMAQERAAALFERTFSVRVTEASWAARAFAMEHSTRAQKVLESLTPEALFEERHVQDYDDSQEEDGGLSFEDTRE